MHALQNEPISRSGFIPPLVPSGTSSSCVRANHYAGDVILRRSACGFTLVEVLVALGIVVIGFLCAYGTVLHSGKLVSAAEEAAFVSSGLEQRIDQLRELAWPELTDGTGITGKVWTAPPQSVSGLTISQETLSIAPYGLATAKTLQATWLASCSPSLSFTAGAQDLSAANAVKVIATLTWTGRRSSHQQTQSIVTVISRGGISKSDLP